MIYNQLNFVKKYRLDFEEFNHLCDILREDEAFVNQQHCGVKKGGSALECKSAVKGAPWEEGGAHAAQKKTFMPHYAFKTRLLPYNGAPDWIEY